MKTILKLSIITALLLNATCMVSQSFIGLAVYQDAKLALIEDQHGNKPFTPDFTAKLKMQGFEGKYGSTVIAIKYRYTDLVDMGYKDYPTGYLWRYGVEAQYNFHMGTDRWGAAPFVGFGIMKRASTRAQNSWEFGGELTYKITNWFSVGAEGVMMERPELGKYVFNGSLGIQFNINTDYGSKQAKKGSRF